MKEKNNNKKNDPQNKNGDKAGQNKENKKKSRWEEQKNKIPLNDYMGKLPPRKSSFWNNLSTALLIFLGLLLVYSLFFEHQEEIEEISLSRLAMDINEGEVERIVVRGHDVEAYYDGDVEKETRIEDRATLTETLVGYGLTPEEMKAVEIEVKRQDGFSYWMMTLGPFLLPLILIFIILWFMLRQAKGAGMQAFSFGQSKARMISPHDKNQRVTFEDVAGAKEAKEELMEIVDFLKNPKKFINIGARIPKGIILMGAPGTGKCVVGETMILTNKGAMEIKDIPTYYAVDDKDRVHGAVLPTIDVEKTTNAKAPASHWYDLGVQDTYRIQLKNGIELEGTPEHPVLVMNEQGELVFKEISQLQEGEYAAVSFKNEAFGNCKKIDEKTSYMMGLLTGDGNMSHSGRIGFTTTDKELEKVFTSFVETYDETLKVQRGSDGITHIVSSWKLKKHLYEMGMSYLLSYDKVIPPSVLQAPREVVVNFLKGLFDSDGSFERYAVTYSTVSLKLADQISALLLNFGIVPKRRVKTPTGQVTPRPVYEISITGVSLKVFREKIGFGLQRKQDKLEEYLKDRSMENTNVDIFPYVSEKVEACWRVMSKEGKSKEGLCKLMHKVRFRKRISRRSLKIFVKAFEESGCHHPDFEYLKKLSEANIFFSPVKGVRKSRNRVYDFTVPGVHSFISNGLVSHNTLLAKAVAGEARVSFFSISGSEFVEMFVGVGASRTRDLFKMAKQAAPAIIFIDEIDAIGRVRGTGVGGGNDEREQTLNQILVEMDGFEPNEKVIIMAATNRPDVLDPALLRPGRFDRRVVIDLPDRKDREAILKVHSRKKPLAEDVDFRVISERTPGFSGADLYSLVNESAILAAREGRKTVTQFDMVRSIEKVMLGPERRSHVLSEHEKKITAYHEAGHALTASVLPFADPVHKISIISRGRAAGYTLKLPTEDRRLHSKKEFLDDIAVSLGGYATELMIFDDLTTGASNDLQVATSLARSMVTRYGMSEKLGPIAMEKSDSTLAQEGGYSSRSEHSQETLSLIDDEVSKLMIDQRERVEKIITENREALEAIAGKLMEVETLEREAYEEILREYGIEPEKKEPWHSDDSESKDKKESEENK
ncbi:MAG: ATP-dependent zinc metalloprotease FtsH [Candidatus Paceibacterota bacterium]